MAVSRKSSQGRSDVYHPHSHQHNESNDQQRGNTTAIHRQHFIDAPSTAADVILGLLTQLARKYLFIDTKKRAYAYMVVVFVLSAISEFDVLPDHYYFVQKHNFLNRFMTKAGWFWMCLFLVPFIWLTSLLHHGSRRKAFRDLSRLAVATFQWYFWTNSFVHVEQRTGFCHGAEKASRNNCSDEGGKWVPGFDISGHAFIFIYSILVIGEEAISFRNWPSEPRHSSVAHDAHVSPGLFFLEYKNFRLSTRIIQCLFIALFVLHLLWDFQLMITLLYYHTISHKIMGAFIGMFCWAVTYRLWYPMAFPFSPIRRHHKIFAPKSN